MTQHYIQTYINKYEDLRDKIDTDFEQRLRETVNTYNNSGDKADNLEDALTDLKEAIHIAVPDDKIVKDLDIQLNNLTFGNTIDIDVINAAIEIYEDIDFEKMFCIQLLYYVGQYYHTKGI